MYFRGKWEGFATHILTEKGLRNGKFSTRVTHHDTIGRQSAGWGIIRFFIHFPMGFLSPPFSNISDYTIMNTEPDVSPDV